MSILRRVERQLDERLRRLFSPAEGRGSEVLEIERGILEDVVSRVQPLRRGRRAFPFRHLTVWLRADDPERRPVLSLAFAEGDQLASDIREALREAGCEPPADLRVDVVLAEEPLAAAGGRDFYIVYREKPDKPAPEAAPAAHLRVVQGRAARESYPVGAGRVNIGRMAEVLDDQQRLVRRNDVVFEEDQANATVSRAHAHIRYDAAAGEFRIYDDHSAYGTNVFRDGTLHTVPAGAGRGMALRAGDEIYLGQARVRFDAE